MESVFVDGLQAFAQASAEVDYPRFADVMDQWGYDWEAFKVHTEDHYILSTFHILGKRGEERVAKSESKGTVLCQHGDLEDGADWMAAFTGIPFHLLLVDAGYDIWIGNNRGTMYSWDHETLSSKDDNEYWMWTWADMGLYDDIANIKMIKEQAGVEKIFYLGYSQGTAQMFYGLAHMESEFHADNLYRVVQLAPCFYPLIPEEYRKPEIADATIMKYQDFGVYAINGPNWERDLQTLCDNFPEEICDNYKATTGRQGQAVQSEKLWTMNGTTQRFQEFDNQWLEGEYETEMVHMSNIKIVPISMFTATEDQTCPYDVASEYIPQIGSETVRIDVEGYDHDYFHSAANSDWFMTNLIEQLQIPAAAEQTSQQITQ